MLSSVKCIGTNSITNMAAQLFELTVEIRMNLG